MYASERFAFGALCDAQVCADARTDIVGAAFPDDFAAVASYYGVGIITDQPDSPHLKAGQIRGECYLAFAETDSYVPDEIVAQLPGLLDAAGTNYRVETYPGTGHGFHNNSTKRFNEAAADLAWERTLAFFDTHLSV